jgi:hypothetical protein
MRWLFPELDIKRLHVERDRDQILGRVLERGRWEDVTWCVARYGREGIHDFFRTVAHPEISARTAWYWRVILQAEDEQWPSLPTFRSHSAALWPG